MTTLAAARTALVAAVGASDDYVDPPGCMVFSNGLQDTSVSLKGSVRWGFRITCYVGVFTDNAAEDVALNAYVAAKTLVILGLAGWSLDGVSGGVVRRLGGGEHYAADIAVSAYVTLS